VRTSVWQECRIRLVPSLVVFNLFFPVWLAWLTESRPGGDLLDQLQENLPFSCVLLLFVIVPSPVLRSTGAPMEHHMLSLHYSVRTGFLPLASLFADWTPELKGLRSSLVGIRKALPAAILMSAGSSIYIAATVPESHAFFLTTAAHSVFVGILLNKLITARLWNICSLEEQLRLQKHYLATSITKL